MGGTGAIRGSMSRTRGHKAVETGTCKSCTTGGCCCCCKNWCHQCGVRKCRAPRSGAWQDDALNTTYTREYPPKSVPIDRKGPAIPPRDSGPFYGLTTNRADYTPKAGRTQSARPEDKAIPWRPFDDSTSYVAHYPPKRADLEVPPQPIYPDLSAPFLGNTTYNTEYIPRRVRPWTAAAARPMPVVPLEGTTEYHDMYDRKAMPDPALRRSQPLLPSKHVATITTYGHDYVPKPFEARERLHCCDDVRHIGADHTCGTHSASRPGTALGATQPRPGTALLTSQGRPGTVVGRTRHA